MTDHDLYLWGLIALTTLGTASWRILGVMIGDRIPKDSIWSDWINAVAYAMVSGVMMLIVIFPSGLMATSAMEWRLSALLVALVVMVVSRSFLVAVISSVLTFVILSKIWI